MHTRHDERATSGAAKLAIETHCADPELDPERLAALVGCSRATLYRAFKQHGASVSATIWNARLDRAAQLLVVDKGKVLLVAEAAFRSGFLDSVSFSRMFKRRFGMSPRDARELGAEPQPVT